MQLCVYVYGDDNIFYMMLVYIVVNRLGVMEKKVWWWLALLWLKNVYIKLIEFTRRSDERKKVNKNPRAKTRR